MAFGDEGVVDDHAVLVARMTRVRFFDRTEGVDLAEESSHDASGSVHGEDLDSDILDGIRISRTGVFVRTRTIRGAPRT